MGNKNNSNTSEAGVVISQLESVGFRAAVMPYSNIVQISEIYYSHIDNSENMPYNTVGHFRSNQPPKISFKPLSFLVIAFQSPEAEIRLNYKGVQVSIPIPATYLDIPTRMRLNDTLQIAAKGYQLANTNGISLKLMAVLSGLGKYGRNTLCFLDGFGSFCNFAAYYTDIPCEDKECNLTRMDICETCSLCVKNCPTGAIGGELAIDTSRCLTMHNEFDNPMPDWLSPDIHHALIGCLRCQYCCPVNKSILRCEKKVFELDEMETEALLLLSPEKFSTELTEKLLSLGIFKWMTRVAGRNAKLIIEAMGI